MKFLKTTMGVAIAGFAAAACLTISTAQAEWKPKGPINVVIGFAAGGGTDTQARLISAELKKDYMIQNYPTKFKIDCSGKRKEWEGIVLLPMVDVSLIKQVYQHCESRLTIPQLKINKRGYTHRYSKSRFKTYFKSFYGNISECSVKLDRISM